MSCETLPTIAELEKTKLLTIHFAELNTGRAGGISTGAIIEYSTNPVTGEVVPTYAKNISVMETEHDNQMLSFENDFDGRLAGMAFTRVGTFTTSATLTDMRQTLLWEVSQGGDGREYGWTGSFDPDGKVVPDGSTPATSGGIGAGAWVDRTDLTLRSELIGIAGAGLSGFGMDTLQKIAEDTGTTPESQGAVGDGVSDDQTEVDNAIEYAKSSVHLRSGSKYLVGQLNNPLGKPLVGPGHVVKSVVGGLEAMTTYADLFQRVTGQENLAHWYKKLYDQLTAASSSMKIVFSGDSTTAGVGVDVNHQIQNLVQRGLYIKGCNPPSGIVVVNAGHSGSPTNDWDSTFVSQDIAHGADLYVVRWGINDPGWLSAGGAAPLDAGQSYPGRRTIEDFATSLRSGLTKYRAAIPFNAGSILLMMPNSTYDVPNARDALWYEQLRNVYVQAARDFQCAFIDTYAIFQDSRYLANILMDDPMATSGRGIHPNNVLNSLIAGHIVDLIAPEGFKYSVSFPSNSVMSVSGAELLPDVGLVPSAYNASLYFVRCITAKGWPMDGNAVTLRSADDTLIQYHFGYLDADRGKLLVRFGRATVLGGQAADWSEWYNIILGDGDITLVTPSAGFTMPSTNQMKIAYSGTHAVVQGSINMTSPAIIAQNAVLCTVPSNMAPLSVAYGVVTLFDGVSTFEQRPCYITMWGEIYLAMASSIAPTSIYVSLCFDSRA